MNTNLTARLDERMPEHPDAMRVEFLTGDLTRRAARVRPDLTVTATDVAGQPVVVVSGPTGAGFTAATWGEGWAIYYSHDQRGDTDVVATLHLPDYDQAAAYMYGLMTAMTPAPF